LDEAIRFYRSFLREQVVMDASKTVTAKFNTQ